MLKHYHLPLWYCFDTFTFILAFQIPRIMFIFMVTVL
jgi:hypothetical protein